ncbi:MAG: FtsX-like permease family protein [Woeseia sp.]|nr:FtsX-like permease family protein [Woeseia sp.]
MATLQRASFGFLLRHPVQLLLAIVGIATGVAVIVAVDLANSSANIAFRLSMDAITGEATHQIVGGPGGLDDALYTELRVQHGVAAIAPVVEGHAEINGESVRVLGVDAFAEREFRNYAMAAAGTAQIGTLLREPGAVLLSEVTAAAWGVATGGQFSLTAAGVTHIATVAGLFSADQSTADLRSLLVTDIATAQYWFAQKNRLSRIDVRRDNVAAVEELRGLLPPSARLLSAAGRTESVAEMSRAFMVNLTAMSLLALLVGIFLIYNSVSFAVLQRRSLISTLRALGLTRGGLFRLILGEALLLGITGSIAGVALGIWLGETLLQLVSQSLNDLYFRSSVTDIIVSRASLIKGFSAGVFATLIAAAIPTIEAASYSPRLGMQRVSLERRTGSMLWKLGAAGLLLILCVVPLLHFSEQSLVAGLVSLFMLVVGMGLCIPFLIRAILTGLAAVIGRLAGDLPRLTIAGIAENLSRTGVAIVALSVAVSATVGVSIMVGSFRVAVIDWIDNTLQADIYVAPVDGDLQPTLVRDIRAVAGAEDSSTSRRVWIETDGERIRLIALDMAPGSYAGIRLLDMIASDIWKRFDEEGGVLVSESYAYRRGVESGDIVALPTDLGERAFEIAGVYRSYDAQAEAIIMSRTIYDLFWDDRTIDSIGLYAEQGADVADITDAIVALSENRQQLQISSNVDLRGQSLAIFDRTFLITNVLYWLALCVAIVGILGALLALQMERARELATLRALGVTRRQLGGMVTLQSGAIGFLSGLCALPLGLLMARLLIEVINRRAFGWSMPVAVGGSTLWSALLLATGVALLAGIYPAWRISQSQPALAMRED